MRKDLIHSRISYSFFLFYMVTYIMLSEMLMLVLIWIMMTHINKKSLSRWILDLNILSVLWYGRDGNLEGFFGVKGNALIWIFESWFWWVLCLELILEFYHDLGVAFEILEWKWVLNQLKSGKLSSAQILNKYLRTPASLSIR